MFDRLAGLADRRARRVVIVAAVLFVLAGALGGRVASRLDPYGADDPATESVKAETALEDAGYRQPRVIVLVRDGSVAAPAMREPGRARSRASCATGATSPGQRLLRHPLAGAFVSRDGGSTYLAVALQDRPTTRRAGRRASDRGDSMAGTGVTVGGRRSPRSRSTSRSSTTCGRAELLAFPLLFLLSLLFFRSLVAALLPLLVGGLAIVGTFLVAARRQRADVGLDLRAQPRRPGSGSGWRSTTACSSSRATARRSPRTAPAWRRCGARWRPPGARSCSAR